MKTLIDVKNEIEELTIEGKLLAPFPSQKSKLDRIKKRIKWLRLAESYLSSDCDPNYIGQSIPLTKIKLQNLMSLCPHDRGNGNPEIKKLVKDWDKKEGVTKLREQIKFMTYLNSAS